MGLNWLKFILTLGAAVIIPAAAQDRPRPEPPHRPSASPRCDSVISQANAGVDQGRLFGDAADYDAKKANWREFKTSADVKAISTGNNLNSVARVWLTNGYVGLVRFDYSSPSGDWNDEVDCCFDSKGTLEIARAELRTFYGNVIHRRDLVRQPNGAFVETGGEFFSLFTGRSASRPTDFGDFFESKIPVIRNVQALPFYDLINLKAK
jgi:hypothetical protein